MKPKHPATRKYLDSGIFDGLGAFHELEQRINELPTDKERGDALEVFAEAYLATQKINQAQEIWPETELPPRLIKKFNLGRRKGVGVDGIYETSAGDWYAYQVKFRSSQNLTYTEVSPFYGITEAFDQRVLITNCNRLASQIDDRPNAFCIRGNDLARLDDSEFEAIVQWLKSVVVEVEKKDTDPHQQEALDTILPALADTDRVSAIMACGTGKTLVTLWAAEQYGCKTVLVLVPSLALIRQTLHEWLAETTWSKMAYLCVCSDPSVQKGADDIVVRPSELDFPVSTDSKNVAEFMSKPFDGVKVVFSTYLSAPVVADGMNEDSAFDFGIFDEAHKTAGRQGKKSSYALDDANLAIRKRLFVTATPRHYSPTKKTKEGDQAVLYSMDNPKVYGPLEKRYELSFAEAARRKIICDYKIVISEISYAAVTNELLSRGEVIVEGDSVRARQVANQLAIKNAIEKFGVKRIFSFHPRVDSAKSFTSDESEGINSIIPDLPAFHVNGKMKASDREAIMAEFSAASRGIVSNAKCLTEGVDVPAVDMVAFMSPKKSKIDIIQATGRAMRIPRGSSNKTVGYVFIPLYIEQAKGETEEEAIRRLGFEELADVLNAMKEQDDVLIDILREMREERGRIGGYDDSRFSEKVKVIGDSIALDVLRESITTMCVDHLGVTWDERYGELEAYKKKYGHCNVPSNYKPNPPLVSWCQNQRTSRSTGVLSDERVNRLEAIAFDFDRFATQWEEMFAALVEFKAEHGHCNVPHGYKSNSKLGHWCITQRMMEGGGALIEERRARLEATGFDFDPIATQWDEMFAALVSFKDEHGHCNVPRGYKSNQALGSWCGTQRRIYRKGELSKERIQRLEAIGFDFDRFATQWEEMFQALIAFKAEHGYCNVPQGNKSNRALAGWCNSQRTLYNKGELSKERIQRLEAIGFDFDPLTTQWEEMFAALVSFKDDHGHCNVPYHDKPNPKLGQWCQKLRQSNKKGKLSDERVERLVAIGFDLDPLTTQWEEMFQALGAFKAEHGHCNVPKRYKPNPKLGQWCNGHRHFYKKNELSDERIARFVAIGFDFDPHATKWEEMFQALVAFKAEHGHCNVSKLSKSNQKLGIWCSNQRLAYNKRKLSEERIARLEAIGFDYDPLSTQWAENYQDLVAYKDEYGHCNVPYGYEPNPKLASWCTNQRVLNNKGNLSDERVERLVAIGFEFDRLISKWEEMFQVLVAFKAEHGHCNVPLRYEPNPKLASWCSNQRQSNRKRKLSDERVERLVAMGFDLDPFATQWEENYQAFAAFKNEHGHCNIPRLYEPYPRLSSWCTVQRTSYKKGELSEERVNRLEAIGFDFDPLTTQWEVMFQALGAFKDENGHCNVPLRYEPIPKLGHWCQIQRTSYKKGKLSDERVERLVAIGFDLDPLTTQWEEMFQALVEFKDENGHCNVPLRYEPIPKLGHWCQIQRTSYKKGKLSEERVERLEAIGFDFDPLTTQWEEMFQALVEFKAEHGHCNIPHSKPPSKLKGWCNHQRKSYKKGKLSQERVERLEAIGFELNPRMGPKPEQ